MTNDSNFSTRRRLASKINESTDVLWSDDSLGEVVDAILAEFVVIPRSGLPEVVKEGGRLKVGDQSLSADRIPSYDYREALLYLALAEHLDARESERAASEAKRTARRDELAAEFCQGGIPYARTTVGLRKAIDMIIGLEGAGA